MAKALDIMAEQEYNKEWQEQKSGKGEGLLKKIGRAARIPLNLLMSLIIVGTIGFTTHKWMKGMEREAQQIELYDKEHVKYLAEHNLLKPAKEYAKKEFDKYGLSGSMFYSEDVKADRSYGVQDVKEGDKLVYYKRRLYKLGEGGNKVEEILPHDISPKDSIFFGKNKEEIYYKATEEESSGGFGTVAPVITFDGNVEPGIRTAYPQGVSASGKIGFSGGLPPSTTETERYYSIQKNEKGEYVKKEIKEEQFLKKKQLRDAEKQQVTIQQKSEKLEEVVNKTNAFLVFSISLLFFLLSGISITGMAIASAAATRIISLTSLFFGLIYLISTFFIVATRMFLQKRNI